MDLLKLLAEIYLLGGVITLISLIYYERSELSDISYRLFMYILLACITVVCWPIILFVNHEL
jgi:hypothetical protein